MNRWVKIGMSVDIVIVKRAVTSYIGEVCKVSASSNEAFIVGKLCHALWAVSKGPVLSSREEV